MQGSERWIQGGMAAIVGLIALVAAGRVEGGGFVTGGILIFAAAVIYVGFLIKDYWDERDSGARHH